jgi:twitching motility protein PilT
VAKIDELFRYTHESGSSDLHLASGLVPRVRLHGALCSVPGWTEQSHEQISQLLHEITNEDQWREYCEGGDLDFAYGIEGLARFRCNFLKHENGAGAVFRIIPQEIMTTEDLKLPEAIERLADLRQGLVLVTGPTGSGKSTTLAAVIDRINRNHCRHVVTIEDPVEFVHPNRKSVFSQREVGHDTDSFASALRGAIRQDADVVLVGEMRDLETIALAITAAEMGALVFGTLHTNGAVNTIDRLIDAFPSEQQSQVRNTLAESLAAVISQLLLPTADGQGRCAAIEIMLRTQGMPNVIREGNTPMLRSIIQGGRADGMQSMDDAIMALLEAKKVTAEAAFSKAHDKGRFERLAKAN